MEKSVVGKSGEEFATRYLEELGWKIVERNFKKPWGEIDIIARDKKGVLVFVEVKTMQSGLTLTPEDNLTYAKFKKISRTASMYAATSDLVGESGWRIDLVAITIPENATLSYREVKKGIALYENISR